VSRSCVQPDEQLPNNDYLQEFLTFLQQEKGFADATIVNREHSLRPFWLGWSHKTCPCPQCRRCGGVAGDYAAAGRSQLAAGGVRSPAARSSNH
jgi:hypothetical protein